jgi:hypothetical protein
MHPGRRQLFEDALLTDDEPTLRLRAVVAQLVAEGISRELLQQELLDWRKDLREHGRDEDEDVVLEVLDFLTGWSSPHMSI